MSLAKFFKMAGQAMFPAQWNDEDLAEFSENKSTKTNNFAKVVCDYLEEAIADGQILLEVNLLRLDKTEQGGHGIQTNTLNSDKTDSKENEDNEDDSDLKQSWEEEEKQFEREIAEFDKQKLGIRHLIYYDDDLPRYYTVKPDFDNLDIDWFRSDITLPGKLLLKQSRPGYRNKSVAYRIGKPTRFGIEFFDDIKLAAFVKEPHICLQKLVSTIRIDIDSDIITRYAAARKHFWGEIVAVIWRCLAINKQRNNHSSKLLMTELRHYFEEHGDMTLPSDSSLYSVIARVLNQYDHRDITNPVLPKFISRPRQKSKKVKD